MDLQSKRHFVSRDVQIVEHVFPFSTLESECPTSITPSQPNYLPHNNIDDEVTSWSGAFEHMQRSSLDNSYTHCAPQADILDERPLEAMIPGGSPNDTALPDDSTIGGQSLSPRGRGHRKKTPSVRLNHYLTSYAAQVDPPSSLLLRWLQQFQLKRNLLLIGKLFVTRVGARLCVLKLMH
ncbi:unnamed protein product [Cuscuta epithymum]|uniref:Uncharacterized protein n=1 Tax=Cuscuta epithymum TaxID=186058 RepID=A0AAV0FAB7_9ASTE|nr:unnamed protein product [Cuscuta epithymum]